MCWLSCYPPIPVVYTFPIFLHLSYCTQISASWKITFLTELLFIYSSWWWFCESDPAAEGRHCEEDMQKYMNADERCSTNSTPKAAPPFSLLQLSSRQAPLFIIEEWNLEIDNQLLEHTNKHATRWLHVLIMWVAKLPIKKGTIKTCCTKADPAAKSGR